MNYPKDIQKIFLEPNTEILLPNCYCKRIIIFSLACGERVIKSCVVKIMNNEFDFKPSKDGLLKSHTLYINGNPQEVVCNIDGLAMNSVMIKNLDEDTHDNESKISLQFSFSECETNTAFDFMKSKYFS